MEKELSHRLHDAAAGSLTDLDDLRLTSVISNFMDSLTDKHLQMIQEGMRDTITREQIGLLMKNIVKIVTQTSLKIILPKLAKVLKMDPQSIWTSLPGSSHDLLSPAERSQTSLNRNEGQEFYGKPPDALLGETEENVLKSVQECLSRSISKLHDGCSSTTSSELSVAIVKEVFNQVNISMSKILMADSDRPSPSLHMNRTMEPGQDMVRAFTANLNDLISGQCSPVPGFCPEVTDAEASLSLMTSEVMTSIVKSISGSIAENQESPVLELLKNVTEKVKLLVDAERHIGKKTPKDGKLSAKSLALHNHVQEKLRNVLDLWKSSMRPASSLKLAQIESDLSTCAKETIGKILTACKETVARNAQSSLGQHSSDTSLEAQLFIDGIMANVEEISGSSSSRGNLQAPPDDVNNLSFCREKLLGEEFHNKADQDVRILVLTYTNNVETNRERDSKLLQDSVPTPSECLTMAFGLLGSAIDKIQELIHLNKRQMSIKSNADVSEMNLWSTALCIHNSLRSQLNVFFTKSGKEYSRSGDVELSDHSLISLDTGKQFSRTNYSDWEVDSITGTSIHSPELKKSGLHRHLTNNKEDGNMGRDVVSMTTLVDCMMAALDLDDPVHHNTPENVFKAAKRLETDLFSKGSTHRITREFSKMVHLVLDRRMTPLRGTFSHSGLMTRREQEDTDMHRSFAYEFLCEFAEESAKRLLLSCIFPRPNSVSSEDLPNLVMPFNVTPECFEVSRRSSEVFADSVEMFTNVMVHQILNFICVPSDSGLDMESCAGGSTHAEDMHTKTASCTMSANQTGSRGLLDTEIKGNSSFAAMLVLRLLTTMSPSLNSANEESSSVAKELIGRILSELDGKSSSANLQDVLRNTAVELLQRFGGDFALGTVLNPQDTVFEETLITVLQKQLDAHASPASAAPPITEEENQAKATIRKCLLSCLKMPKLSILKKFKIQKSKKVSDGSSRHTMDQGHGPSHCASDSGRSSKTRKYIFSALKLSKFNIFKQLIKKKSKEEFQGGIEQLCSSKLPF